jgi:hypothetical protein
MISVENYYCINEKILASLYTVSLYFSDINLLNITKFLAS